MEKIIIREVGDYELNLIDAFSETNLADVLFDAGVLCVTWGITPWTYYIYSASTIEQVGQLPLGAAPKISGIYRISEKVSKLSLIPGEFLENWPSCLKKEWPKIEISGEGTTLKLDLHTRRFNPPSGNHGPTLAMFNIYRTSTKEEVSPLLNIDIESI